MTLCEGIMRKLLTYLLVFSLCMEVGGDIHSLLRDLDEAEHEQHGNRDSLVIDEYRKTLIKEEILNRLGLSSPPNISSNSVLPTQILQNVLFQKNSESEGITKDTNAYYGVTKQVVVMAEPEKASDSEGTGRQTLRFHTDYRSHAISSVILGFHRDPRVLTKQILKQENSVLLRVLEDTSTLRYRPVQIMKKDHNWLTVNITDESLNFGNENVIKNLTLEVICELCGNRTFMWNTITYRPFLILNIKPENKKRVARSFRCSDDDKGCCLVKYQVKFSDLGWGSWIIAPDSIDLNYCKGSCGPFETYNKPRNLLMERLSRPSNSAPFAQPCCVVTKMASVSLLYRTGPDIHAIEKKDVPNLRAADCQCS